MLLIPVGTDAPVYHFPWGTIGLIAANTLITLAAAANPAAAGDWILVYGDGLHPLQWVSSNFIHGHGGTPVDIGLHLLGNMVFLWGFGLIIEGKVGWRTFLAIYLGLGVAQSGLEQALMLGLKGSGVDSNLPQGSCGASSILFGLMAIALIWAPKNELSILVAGFIMRLFVFTFDVSILVFSLVFLGLEAGIALIIGFHWGSEVLHLMGAVLGLPLGIVMLKRGWVDCEGWDLFSVMAGSHLKTIAEDEDPVRWRNALQGMAVTGTIASTVRSAGPVAHDEGPDDERPSPTEPPPGAVKRLRGHLEQAKPGAALAEYRKCKLIAPQWTPDASLLKSLIQALMKGRQWGDVVPLLEEQIDRYPEEADKARIRLAGIVVEVHKRPAYALRLIGAVDRANLSPELAETCHRIERAALKLQEEGVIELEGRAWN